MNTMVGYTMERNRPDRLKSHSPLPPRTDPRINRTAPIPPNPQMLLTAPRADTAGENTSLPTVIPP